MTQRKDGWLSMEEIRSPVTVNPDFWPWAWVTLIVFAVTPHTQKHAHNQTMTFLKVSELSWRSDSGLDGNWKRRQTKKRLSMRFFPVPFKEKKLHKNLGLAITATLCLASLGYSGVQSLLSVFGILSWYDRHQASHFKKLYHSLSQSLSFSKKRGQKLQGFQGWGGFLPYGVFFLNQKRLWGKALPHIKFQSAFRFRLKAPFPNFRKGGLEEAMGRRCLHNITDSNATNKSFHRL